MKKNVAGQKIGAQMVSATDGSAFTGAVTVYVTVDAVTQGAGSVGSGACTHEGEGYHTYAPSDAETNGDLVAFTFKAAGAVNATVQVFPQVVYTATLDTLASQISAIGSGTGAALNFAASDDNANDTVGGVALTHVGTETGTFANTAADDTSTHVIASADVAGTHTITWAYSFACGAAKAASQVSWKGTLSYTAAPANTDTFTFSAWNGATWDTRLVVVNATTAVQTFDIPLLAAHTTVAGLVILRITYAEADAGTLTTNLLLCKAQQSGSQIGYANGSVWVSTTGTAAAVPYVNGTADNPCPWANALTVAAALGLTRYTVTPGTTVTLGAALVGAVMTGRSYILDLGAQNVSKSYFEGVEGLIASGATCATGEAIIVDCHLGAVTIGEADFVRCHLNGTITMAQASVPYRFHDCTGIATAKITFGAATQAAVVSGASGVLTIAGMTAGDTLYIDGNCSLTLDATNDGGTVHINGIVALTNLGSGQTITYADDSTNTTSLLARVARRWSE